MAVDTYSPEILRKRFALYKDNEIAVRDIRRETNLPIRGQNPPEDITENIVKNILRKNGDTTCVWAKCVGRPGDLYSDVELVQEVKAFTSGGPSSFGPDKQFNVIYFLDMREYLSDRFVLWRLALTNTSPEWKGLKVNLAQTFDDQATQGRRPHLGFDSIYEQLRDVRNDAGEPICTMVYDGPFEEIF
jgi:hypothetical protein